MTSQFDLTRFYVFIICNSVFQLALLTREFQILLRLCSSNICNFCFRNIDSSSGLVYTWLYYMRRLQALVCFCYSNIRVFRRRLVFIKKFQMFFVVKSLWRNKLHKPSGKVSNLRKPTQKKKWTLFKIENNFSCYLNRFTLKTWKIVT